MSVEQKIPTYPEGIYLLEKSSSLSTALPAGFYRTKGNEYPFFKIGYVAKFWTSNGNGGLDNAPIHIVLSSNWDDADINGDTSKLSDGFSVRCVKD